MLRVVYKYHHITNGLYQILVYRDSNEGKYDQQISLAPWSGAKRLVQPWFQLPGNEAIVTQLSDVELLGTVQKLRNAGRNAGKCPVSAGKRAINGL